MWLTGDPAADELLASDPFALLLGMLLDQQVPIQWAFKAPLRIRERMGDSFTVRAMAESTEAEVVDVFARKPAVHRFPAAMAKRAHALAVELTQRHGDKPARLWLDVSDGAELFGRLVALPGFGEEKARIFIALLAKRFGVRPPGWEAACAPFDDEQPRTVADIDSPDALARVKEWKQRQRAEGRSKSD